MSLGSLFGSAGMDFASKLIEMDWKSDEASFARDWSAEQARQSRGWQEEMRGSQYQTAVADMKAAGLNPMLAYMQGGAGNLPGAMGQTSTASGIDAWQPSESMRRGAETGKATSATRVLDAQEENVKADTEKKRAEAEEVRARTPTHGVNIDRMRQEIEESIQRIQTLAAQAGHHVASAAQAAQNVENLKEMIPQIQATVKNLQSMTQLNHTQIQALGMQMGKTVAETEEIIQRVKQNLPELMARIHELDALGRQAEMPGKARVSDVMESKLGGIVSIFRAMFK